MNDNSTRNLKKRSIDKTVLLCFLSIICAVLSLALWLGGVLIVEDYMDAAGVGKFVPIWVLPTLFVVTINLLLNTIFWCRNPVLRKRLLLVACPIVALCALAFAILFTTVDLQPAELLQM